MRREPRTIEAASALSSFSPALAQMLAVRPEIIRRLFLEREFEQPLKPDRLLAELSRATASAAGLESLQSVLRQVRLREMARLAVRDLTGRADLAEVTRSLSSLADACLTAALDAAMRQVAAKYGRTPGTIGFFPVILGMGKLGGRELSYGSDLDIVFVVGRGRGSARLSMENTVRLAQRLTSFLSVHLEEGPGYEIDSRLRPSGRSGPLVVSPASLAAYHRTSRLWERQALIRMRHVLGPASLGDRVRRVARAAVYRQELPADAAAQIHRLRVRMTRERAQIRPGTINLKFSPGGLVDVEFVTQYLQMVHGRTEQGRVRSPATVAAIQALSRRGLGPSGLAELAGAYELVTRVANRLGLIHARGGDTAAFTPEEVSGLDLAVTGPDPLACLQSAMETARGLYREVFGQESDHDE